MGSQASKSDLPEVMTDAELAALQLDANPSARVPIVYTDAYNIGFMGLEKLHPFDSKKYSKVHARLTASGEEGGLLRKDELHVPFEATQRLLRIVHPQEYLDSLTSSVAVAKILEVPPLAILPNSIVQSHALRPMRFATGGTLLGAELAVRASMHAAGVQARADAVAAAPAEEAVASAAAQPVDSSGLSGSSDSSSSSASSSSASSPSLAAALPALVAPSAPAGVLPGWSINLSGGFHHCSARVGGGFCPYADITLAIIFLRRKFGPLLQRVMILDCDAHQGNGHENDKRNGVFKDAGVDVYIMDMYNELIYPFDSRAARHIDCPVRLQHGVGDEEYLSKLTSNLTRSLDKFHPQLLVYNAGTDCLAGDSLGRLNVSADGIVERDRIVFDMCLRRGVPIVMLLSGGYQQTNAAVIASSIANLQSSLHLWDVDPALLAKRAKHEASEQQKAAVGSKKLPKGKRKAPPAASHGKNNKDEAEEERKEERKEEQEPDLERSPQSKL